MTVKSEIRAINANIKFQHEINFRILVMSAHSFMALLYVGQGIERRMEFADDNGPKGRKK